MRKKTLLSFGLLLTVIYSLTAQDMLVATKISQRASSMQRIGTTDVTVVYNSPLAKNRKIFGGIVPFDFVVDGVEYPWRAGSNENTTINFTHDVTIQGKPLKKGKYGLHIFVKENEWIFIFSDKNDNWGSFSYQKEEDALRVSAQPEQTSYQEWLSYNFIEREAESAVLELHWATTKCGIKISVDVNDNILTDLKSKEEKTSDDYVKIAQLTTALGDDQIDLALEFTDKSLEIGEGFRNMMLKSELLSKKGHLKEAERYKKEALALGKGFPYHYYYPLSFMMLHGKNAKTYQLLSEMLVKEPNNWIANLAMGEYYIKMANQEKATFHFARAYEFAGERSKPYTRYMYLSNKLILSK